MPKPLFDEATIAAATAQYGMVELLSPALGQILRELASELQDRLMENHGGGSDWMECPCGGTVSRNMCDGSGRFTEYDENHVCPLTVLRQVLNNS